MRRLPTLWHQILTGLGVLGAGAVVLLVSRHLFGPPPLPGESASPKFPPGSPAANPTRPELHQWARPIIREALQRTLGRDPALFELQYGHAIAFLESTYGRGWKGRMVGSNNWGAVQCPKSAVAGVDELLEDIALPFNLWDEDATQWDEDPATGELIIAGAGGCIEYEDSFADGTRYKVSFRRYDTPVDGAADMLRHVFKLRPRTAQALASKDATCFRASFAMRRERYFEGFCPKATNRYGSGGVRPSLKSPDRDDATRACAREAIETHAKLVHTHATNVAGACGDPVVLPLGTYEDAEEWYRATFPDAGPGAPPPAASSPAPAPGSAPAPAPAPASPPAATSAPAASSPKVTPGRSGGRLLEAVKTGAIEEPTWVEVSWTAAGEVLLVSADALRASVDGELLRLPVTWRETLDIAGRLDLVPLTAEVSDLIWQAAALKLQPLTLGRWDTKEEQLESSRMMASIEWCQRHDRHLDKQIDAAGARGKLVADVGKDWIFSPRLLLGPRLGVTYGWRYSNGNIIQKLGPDEKLPAHNDEHYDQSQKFRAVQRRTKAGTDVLKIYEARGLKPAVLALFTGGRQ